MRHRIIGLSLGAALAAAAQNAMACAACYGKSDSDLAHGMNWGIFALLLVVTFVLGGIASFFVYIARRAAAQGHPQSTQSTETR